MVLYIGCSCIQKKVSCPSVTSERVYTSMIHEAFGTSAEIEKITNTLRLFHKILTEKPRKGRLENMMNEKGRQKETYPQQTGVVWNPVLSL